MRYIPLSDEELDKEVESCITEAISALQELNDEVIPDSLLDELEGVVEGYDWAKIILENHYSLYEDYVDDHRND